MANKFANHIVSVNNKSYLLKIPNEYADISTVVGVTIPADAAAAAAASKSSVKALVEGGEIAKLRVGIGAVGTKLKYHYIVCPIDKLASAIAGLEGKNLTDGNTQIGTIRTVGFRAKRSRS